jgi:hypothetical protein
MPSPHRTEWHKLKDKHAAALKAKKIVFDKDLGPLLDKLHELRDKMDLASKKTAKEHAKKAAGIVDTYLTRVQGKLGGPEEKELRSRLLLIQSSVNSFR